MKSPDTKLRKANSVNWLRSIFSALFFGGLWGGWAYLCNYSFGPERASAALVTQFCFSFTGTFFFTLAVDWLYDLKESLWEKVFYSLIVPLSTILAILVSIHYLRNTPRIFATIAPSFSIAALYCLIKILKGVAGSYQISGLAIAESDDKFLNK